MRIGITCHHTYGGSGTVATELGMALAKRGHQVHFVTFAEPYRLQFDPNIYLHQVDVMHYPLFDHPPTTLSLAAKMAETICTEKLDLLHVHYAIPHATAAYLALKLCPEHNVRLVTTLHGTDITLVGQDPSYFSITRFSIEQSDVVTAVSQWLKDQTLSRFKVAHPIEVIYNSVDTERFRRVSVPACQRARYAPGGEPILVHISNFRPLKRVTDVIRAFALVRKRMAAKLLMIGDGPHRMPAQEVALELGVMGDVWFLGKQDRVELFLSLADLFLLPSEHESFGLAALEAMACEVPVIASRAGGLVEVIEDGVSGHLVEVGDTEMMAELATRVLKDQELAARIRAAALDRVHRLFSADKIVAEYEQLYRTALSSPKHQS
ncbi:MAG TPA: N-acetyl-alpha-D-glucosaminyl L-malate synthase BshA [Candidatus Latescibacteria bacterium]|nr:N-acetyl-alpha-D-glucosaminyl L-malate synthase BshA [Candidatus Latescibacterota bacterium]